MVLRLCVCVRVAISNSLRSILKCPQLIVTCVSLPELPLEMERRPKAAWAAAGPDVNECFKAASINAKANDQIPTQIGLLTKLNSLTELITGREGET